MKTFRHYIYELLQHIFHFAVWHTAPIQEREYAKHIAYKVGCLAADMPFDVVGGGYEIVEIGCGLGDIIANINYPQGSKIGYDISPEAIRAARFIHPQCKFDVGTFSDVAGHKIAILIAVNFLHAIEISEVENMFNALLSKNDVRMIVVDQVQNPPYQYLHDYVKLLGKFGYSLSSFRGFEAWKGSRRKVLYFKKCV